MGARVRARGARGRRILRVAGGRSAGSGAGDADWRLRRAGAGGRCGRYPLVSPEGIGTIEFTARAPGVVRLTFAATPPDRTHGPTPRRRRDRDPVHAARSDAGLRPRGDTARSLADPRQDGSGRHVDRGRARYHAPPARPHDGAGRASRDPDLARSRVLSAGDPPTDVALRAAAKPRRSRSSTMTSDGDSAGSDELRWKRAGSRGSRAARRCPSPRARRSRRAPRAAPCARGARGREIEVVALLLAPAAVRDNERAAPLEPDEVEEAQARDAHERRVVEETVEAEALERGDRHGMVDEEQRCPARGVREHLDRLGEQPAGCSESSKRWSETMPNGRPGSPRGGGCVGHEREAVANRVRARVDDIAAAEVGRGPGPGA